MWAEGNQTRRQPGGRRGHSFPLPGGLEVLNATQLRAAVPSGGLGIACLGFPPPFPQGRPWILGGGSWTDPASPLLSHPAERDGILSCSQAGTRAERGTGQRRWAVAAPRGWLRIPHGCRITGRESHPLVPDRSGQGGRGARLGDGAVAGPGGEVSTCLCPGLGAAGTALPCGQQEGDGGDPSGHRDARRADGPQPPPCLINFAEPYRPAQPPSPPQGHHDLSLLGLGPQAKVPEPRPPQAKVLAGHAAPLSHYSFRQQLISEPACAEEMMRGGGGCRKTFAGLPGAGHRAQSEITLAPWTASTTWRDRQHPGTGSCWVRESCQALVINEALIWQGRR